MNESQNMTPFPVNDAAYGIKSESSDNVSQVLPLETNASIDEPVEIIELESSKKKSENIVSSHSILSSLAYWGIRQSPYVYPKNLEKALQAAHENLIQWEYFPDEKNMPSSYKRFTNMELHVLIDRLVKQTPEIAIWNIAQVEQDVGITNPEDPKRIIRWNFVFPDPLVYPKADRDFIDLDALVKNIYNSID